MTHHFGEPDPERPGSLFEKPTRTTAPAAPRDADEVSTDVAAADAAPGDGGRADDAREAAETVGGGAAGSEDRAADEGRDVRGASRPAADRRAEPGTGVNGAGPGAADDPPTTTWDRPSADAARDGRGAGAAGAAALGGVGADRPAPGGNSQGDDEQATAAVPAAGDPVDRQASGWNRSAVDPFATAPMPATRSGGSRPVLHPQPAGDPAPAHTLVDDAPTEALPVVDPAAADAVPEWRPPKQTSRLTTILIIALLVAVGFLAGVFVGRAAAPASTGGEQPRPAATSSAESDGHR